MLNNTAYIGIGSNLGNPIENVRKAIKLLSQLSNTYLDKTSSLYRSDPFEASGDDYINLVVRLRTDLCPDALITRLWDIENLFGRERPYKNAPRTLDLDILLYNNLQIQTRYLTIPHPRMTDRAFVLVPLLEIDPEISISGKEPLHILVSRLNDQKINRLNI